jgi:putative ABC transport system permease protein
MYILSFSDLIWLAVPLVFVLYIYWRWSQDATTIPYAIARMFLQLITIGYVLTYIFETQNLLYTFLILSIMLFAASIIALRPITNKKPRNYLISFVAILLGGGITLSMVVFLVVDLKLWYEPRYVIPLAGMIFSSSMNALSLAGERFSNEYNRSQNYIEARSIAYKASLIPIVNTLFAVGLVSIPGMMTGQILSGVDPIIALKYQIMVMLMILSSSGLSSAIYLSFMRPK